MKILQTVVIKQVLTEKSKEKLLDSLIHTRNTLQKEMEQIRFEIRKIEKQKKLPSSKVQPYYEREINKRTDKIKLLDFQIEQIQKLPLGSEIKEKEVQSLVDVNIGDNWEELTKSRTIVIKEGIVEEIR